MPDSTRHGLEQHVERLRLLARFAAESAWSTGLDAVAEQALTTALQGFSFDRGEIVLLQPGAPDGVHVTLTSGENATQHEGLPARLVSVTLAALTRQWSQGAHDGSSPMSGPPSAELLRLLGEHDRREDAGVHDVPGGRRVPASADDAQVLMLRVRGAIVGCLWLSRSAEAGRQALAVNGASAEANAEGVLLELFRQHVEAAVGHALLHGELATRISELEEARDAAVRANQSKSTFLANMSHELRTPLNAVIGYAEMLMEETDAIMDEGGRPARAVAQFPADLGRIRSAGRHLLSIINDILDLTRIESGKLASRVELVDVPDLIHDLQTTVDPLAAANRNRFLVEIGPNVRVARTDGAMMRQILFNLLSNACKFTQGGEVRLQVLRPPGSDDLVFEVRDTGIGMDEAQLARVFDAFVQADDATTRAYGGTGLGLTLTRHLCRLLGGDVAVRSTPGAGTTFTVHLAVDLQAQREPEAAADTPDSIRVPKGGAAHDAVVTHAGTVLVVDDDPVMRDLLRRVIEREGFHVAVAANGFEGIKLARELRPVAITLDVMMPGMDGWTLLRHLKEDPELASIPVAMVTMVDESSGRTALGADHYLMKPIDRAALSRVLARYRRPDTSAAGVVLLIEDDEPTRGLMRRVLTIDGWHVTEATNGVEALAALERVTPDIVLLDLMMPQMDGFTFLKHFRADPAHRDIPVVVVTAKELTADEERRLRGDVAQVMAKRGGTTGERMLAELRTLLARLVSSGARG